MILKAANGVPLAVCRKCLSLRTFHAPNTTIKDTLKHHTPFSAIRLARLTTNSFISSLSATLIPALCRFKVLLWKSRLLWKAYGVGPLAIGCPEDLKQISRSGTHEKTTSSNYTWSKMNRCLKSSVPWPRKAFLERERQSTPEITSLIRQKKTTIRKIIQKMARLEKCAEKRMGLYPRSPQ